MNKLKNLFQLWIPILLGITAFMLITGGKIIWPSNINWLFLNPDVSNDLCAWQFYRDTPIFQNPLGANYPYGMGIGGSISFADPLFLFAFPFKLIASLLPTPFQYQGLWIFLCFILQAMFSWKLLEKITDDAWLKFLGSTFFVLAPPLLWRLHGSPSFFGQWLILAGIFLYLSSPYPKCAWLALLCISSLVHPYFLLMLLALWSADLIMRKFTTKLTYKEIIKFICLTGISLLIVIWQAGYFMLKSGLEASGLGLFRMNLLSFIDPTDGFFGSWSYILKNQPRTWGDYEGFSYLGLGMLILGVTALFKLIEREKIRNLFFQHKRLIPLFGIAFLLMIFAISNRIVIGRYELIHYQLPDIFNMFRASGRMSLPIYYLLSLGILYIIIKNNRRLTAIIIISICLAIQILDSSNIFIHFRNSFNHAQPYISALKAPVWKLIAQKYKKLLYVLPENNSENLHLVYYAAFNKLNINRGYFARVDTEKINNERIKLSEKLKHGHLDKDAFYVINDKNLLRIIAHTEMNLLYKVMLADGFSLLLPNWNNNSRDIEQLNWLKNSLYNIGTPISFQGFKSNFEKYLTLQGEDGWSTPESSGTWTDGNIITLSIPLAEKPKSNLLLTIDAMPFINIKHPNLEVEVFVNHKRVGELFYAIQNSSSIKDIEIPSVFVSKSDLLEIKFIINNAISPAALGLSSDIRKLGLFISFLTLTYKK